MIIDAHTHLDFFGDKINGAIEEINKNKILTIANSMDIESYKLNKNFAKNSDYIIPAFGIHPWKAKEFNEDFNILIPYIDEALMIGEIGLDYFWEEDKSTYKKQREIFEFMLSESLKRDKIVNVHTKGAENEIFDLLKKYNAERVIIHWYSGELNTLKKLIDLGCYFTASVQLGYSNEIDEIIKNVPINRLLTETDGPTALEWVNGKYGMPSVIKDVIKKLSTIKKIEENVLISNINDNIKRLCDRTKIMDVLTNICV